MIFFPFRRYICFAIQTGTHNNDKGDARIPNPEGYCNKTAKKKEKDLFFKVNIWMVLIMKVRYRYFVCLGANLIGFCDIIACRKDIHRYQQKSSL